MLQFPARNIPSQNRGRMGSARIRANSKNREKSGKILASRIFGDSLGRQGGGCSLKQSVGVRRRLSGDRLIMHQPAARPQKRRPGGQYGVFGSPRKISEEHGFEICRSATEKIRHRSPGGVSAQAPASVATRRQFGSRAVTSRAKVQISIISTTLSGLPSTTAPARSRVAVMSFDKT